MSNDHFLHSITVLDTETTNLIPELAEVVEIAAARWTKTGWNIDSLLLGAVNGIPPEASAKNNISNKMIDGLPTFADSADSIIKLLNWTTSNYYVAHNAKYDRAVLSHAWKGTTHQKAAKECDDQSKWLCTWRLSQHILRHEFTDCEYGLNYLRYKLDLTVKDDIQTHRAGDDTLLCATLLDYLIAAAIKNRQIDPEDDVLRQLNELCWRPIIQTTWPFGKYRGKLLTDLPNDYYAWAFANIPSLNESSTDFNSDLAESVRLVLEERLSD